jgi:hypothetical protein
MQPERDRRGRLPASEQPIVFLVGKDLGDQDHGANTRSGRNHVDATIRERRLEAPGIRRRSRKTAARRELWWNAILRNLVTREAVLLEPSDPPSELFPLFRLKICFGGDCTRSQSDLAR